MDNVQPAVHLDVPVTDAERARARRRRRDQERSAALLPEPRSTFQNQPTFLRFPSIRGAPGIRHLPPSLSQNFEDRQYVPISPIDEEDEPNSIQLREPSERQADSGYLLPSPGPIPQLWTPIWLKQWMLTGLALVFAALLVGLVLLWHFDQRNQGFPVAKTTTHLAWAYAPTVIVVIAVAAWRMVDFHAKLAMPFDSLQNGPVRPSEGLFVDYISRFQLVSLLEAFKNSHFAVMTTITGFLLLKLATVFATGLFVPLPSRVPLAGSSVLARGFSAATFDPSIDLNTSNFSASPLYAYYGTKARGMPLENGVRFDLAYALMTINSTSPIDQGSIISGDVDAFVPIMTCQRLDVKLDTPAVVNDSNAADAFATSSNISLTIQGGDICDQSTSLGVAAGNPYTEILSSHQINGTVQEVYCGSNNSGGPGSQEPSGLLFTITDINYQQVLFDNATDLAGGAFTIANNVSRTLANMTNVFCRGSYTITKVSVINDTRIADSNQAISVTLKEGAPNSTLPQFSKWNATNVFQLSSISAEALFGDTVNAETRSDSEAMFTLMALTHGLQDIDSLMDANKLVSAAQDTYTGILSQYAHQTLRANSNSALEGGSVASEEQRLRINDVSLWTLASVFGSLVLFCVVLIFIAPRAVVPRNPSSIATIAMILTRSTELNRLLRRHGTPSPVNQRSALVGHEFGTAIATTPSGMNSFKIVTSEGEPGEHGREPNTNLKWWLPITARAPVIVLTLVLPLVVIVGLEIIQRSSNRHHGFYTVTDTKSTEDYSHYIPGIVMLLLATLVNFLDFNVALFGPWANLTKGNANSRDSVLNNILGRSPLSAFLQAFRTRYLGALLSIPAATLASILTVIVSGLFYVQDVTVAGPDVSLTQLDSFDLRWPNSFTTDTGAAALVDLMLHQNISYPQSTYEDLVFPALSLDNSTLLADSASTMHDPWNHVFSAVRGNLRCDVLPESAFNVTTEQAGSDSAYATDQAFVVATAALPNSCRLGGYQGNDSFVTYEHNFELPEGGQGTYAGAQLDLLFGENATLYGNYGEARGQYIGDNPAVGCPSLAFTFGHFRLNSTDKSQVTSIICYQEIQGLNVNVTLKPNSTTIDPDHPPVIQESSVFLHDNPASTTGAQSFDFRIQNNLAQEMTVFDGTPASDSSSTDTFDIYFQAVLNGTEKRDPASLAGQNNQDVLIDAINHFYGIYMAQVISINMRVPAGKGSSSSGTSSQLHPRQDSTTTSIISTTMTTPRLVQDRTSKLILQILLGVMTALSAGAWMTSKMRRVLPCNPCSLAGTMSLLAGSDLCYSVDDGLCECCGKARRRSFGNDGDGDHPSAAAGAAVGIHHEPIHIEADENDVPGDDGVETDETRRNRRTQLIPDGAEWMSRAQFDSVFAGKRYSMGWWRERKPLGKRRRFGLDVGARADGADDQDWELGERRPQGGTGFGDFMMVRGGDRDGRGEYSHFSRFRNRSRSRSWGRSAGDRSGDGRGMSMSMSRSRSRSRSRSVNRSAAAVVAIPEPSARERAAEAESSRDTRPGPEPEPEPDSTSPLIGMVGRERRRFRFEDGGDGGPSTAVAGAMAVTRRQQQEQDSRSLMGGEA